MNKDEKLCKMPRGVLADLIDYKALRPGMRLVLDDMSSDPCPIESGTQGIVTGHDAIGDCQMEWDNGSSLKLLDIDRFHIVASEDELDGSFVWLGRKQGEGYDACPRCGKKFDVRRGAVSRRIKNKNIMICDTCGQQEAIEDFLIHGREYGFDVNVSVPEGKNHTGFETTGEIDEGGRQRINAQVKSIADWYIVKQWQGRA